MDWSLHPQLPGIPLSQRGIEVGFRPLHPWACRGAKPLCIFFYPPRMGDQRGLISNVDTLAAGFVSLYSPYISKVALSIPGCAGVIRLRRTEGLAMFTHHRHALHRHVPPMGDQRGLVSNVDTLAAGFVSLYPPYGLSKTGATTEGLPLQEVQRDAAGGLGVSPRYSLLPPRMGVRGLNTV